MLMPLWVLEEEFPARSVQVPVADRFRPVPVTTCCTVAETGPDPLSAHDQMTVTGPLAQPAAFTPWALLNWVVGGVWSILMEETVAVAVLPATSLHVPITWPPFTSVVTV